MPPTSSPSSTRAVTHRRHTTKTKTVSSKSSSPAPPAPALPTNKLNILDRDDKAGELQDFIWVMEDEPHRTRRHALIKQHPKEINALLGYEWKTKWLVLCLWIFHISCAYAMREDALWGGTPRFYALAYFVGAFVTQALFLAVHEISHNLAFKSFTHNKLFGIFTNIPMVLPFFVAFKHYHNEHHKFQGVIGVDTDLPSRIETACLKSRIGKWFFMFNQTWFYAFRPLLVRPQAFTSWHMLNVAVQVAFIAGTVYAVGWGPILYLLLCDHISGSWHPIAGHFLAEHYVFAGNVETASYYGPLNKLTFNVGYHNEHHDFPLVPWSRLPLLEKIGDYKNTLPHHTSWTRVLIEFLFNDNVGLYNRVARHPNVTASAEKAAHSLSATTSADYDEKEWKN